MISTNTTNTSLVDLLSLDPGELKELLATIGEPAVLAAAPRTSARADDQHRQGDPPKAGNRCHLALAHN